MEKCLSWQEGNVGLSGIALVFGVTRAVDVHCIAIMFYGNWASG